MLDEVRQRVATLQLPPMFFPTSRALARGRAPVHAGAHRQAAQGRLRWRPSPRVAALHPCAPTPATELLGYLSSGIGEACDGGWPLGFCDAKNWIGLADRIRHSDGRSDYAA